MKETNAIKSFKRFLLAGLIGASGLGFSASIYGEDKTPLWAYAPDTISPEWGEFIAEKGKHREHALPALDDIGGWKKFQAAAAEAGESRADEIAAAFNVSYTEIGLGGVPIVEVTPNDLKHSDKIVVYTHGGGYVLFSAKSAMHTSALLAAATGLKVYSVDYTLAPHSKWENTTGEVVSVFKALLEDGYEMDQIVLCGDSAGGGLAAGSTLKMRDLGMGMPAALVLWSPWADISRRGDTLVTLADAEVFYTYESVLGPASLAYADPGDHMHPYASPVYGDFSKGYPPTLIQGGTKEILLSGIIRLYQAIDQAGQIVKLDLYEGMPHVFPPILPKSKESRVAMKKVNAWVTEHLGLN